MKSTDLHLIFHNIIEFKLGISVDEGFHGGLLPSYCNRTSNPMLLRHPN